MVDIVRRAFAPSDDVPVEVNPSAWPALLSTLERHRCLGMAQASFLAGQVDLGPEQATALGARVEAWLTLSLRVERLAIAAHRSLTAAGIEHRFLKGVVSANTVYPDPSWRHFADADLLVPAHQLHDAVTALAGDLGARRLLPERRPGWDARFAKDLPLRIDGIELDLHRTLVPGRAGLRLPLHELFASLDTVTLGNIALPMLDQRWRAEHARLCCIAGDQTPRLATMVDADLLAGRAPAGRRPAARIWRHPRVRDAIAVTAVRRGRAAYVCGLVKPSSAYRSARRMSTSS